MTLFQERLEQFLASISLDVPQGVLVEIDHFLPDEWTSTVDDGVHYVQGPSGSMWERVVRRLVGVLAYSEGSVLRRVSPDQWELYTWRNDHGEGFKVVFVAKP